VTLDVFLWLEAFVDIVKHFFVFNKDLGHVVFNFDLVLVQKIDLNASSIVLQVLVPVNCVYITVKL
jgi:hypothetical protein